MTIEQEIEFEFYFELLRVDDEYDPSDVQRIDVWVPGLLPFDKPSPVSFVLESIIERIPSWERVDEFINTLLGPGHEQGSYQLYGKGKLIDYYDNATQEYDQVIQYDVKEYAAIAQEHVDTILAEVDEDLDDLDDSTTELMEELGYERLDEFADFDDFDDD